MGQMDRKYRTVNTGPDRRAAWRDRRIALARLAAAHRFRFSVSVARRFRKANAAKPDVPTPSRQWSKTRQMSAPGPEAATEFLAGI